jgi:carbon-monoxide dehydrogenase medium subunit
MKPAAFDYVRPASIGEAVALLASRPDAKVLAGGQTLGPMLNLRLAQPELLVDITRIPELAVIERGHDATTVGAVVTHSAIEDMRARVEGPAGDFLARVARGIAYRAVRTRGTIGGSIAHADPAADWLSCLAALGADVLVTGPSGSRTAALAGFVRGAMEVNLEAGELITAVRIPQFKAGSRFGYHKICRKTGEFAEAIGAVAVDPERGISRIVSGAWDGPPILLDASAYTLGSSTAALPGRMHLEEALAKAGRSGDAYDIRIHAVAVHRALAEALRP